VSIERLYTHVQQAVRLAKQHKWSFEKLQDRVAWYWFGDAEPPAETERESIVNQEPSKP
jgi:hypothetical protein